MLRKLLLGLALGWVVSCAYAQTAPSPADVGISKGTPDVFKLKGHDDVWTPFGSIDPITHVFTPAGGSGIVGGTTPVTGACPNGQFLYNNSAVVGCASVAGGGAAPFTLYPTHALLTAGVTTPSGGASTVAQQGFYAAGDGGEATYQWNVASYCPKGTSGSPTPADGLSCILPIGQSASTAGRYLLSLTDGAFNARQFGMQPSTDLSFDNFPFVRPMMAAIGIQGQPNGPDIIFPVTLGQDYTLYYFSQPFELTKSVSLRCTTSGSGTGSFGNRVQFIFPPGIDGVIQENGRWSSDGSSDGSSGISGCTVSSTGYFESSWTSSPGAIDGASVMTGVHSVHGVGLSNIPVPLIAAGDGLAILPANSNFSGGGPAVHPGAYVQSVSGAAGNQTINLAQTADGAPRNYVLHQPPFVFGGLVEGAVMWDLPASEAYTVTIAAITPGVAQHAVITGGKRPLKPGDLIWSDPFVYGTLIYDPHNAVASATVHSGGSGYTGASGTMTWGGSIVCGANPVLNVTASGGVITGVTSVATPGECNAAFIPSTATGWVAGGGLSGGSGATFNTAYANTVEFDTVTSWGYPSTAQATGTFKLWKLGAGIMRRVAANTRGSRSEFFSLGIELFCGPGGAGCSTAFDQNGSYDHSIIGRFATGTDGMPATSMGEEFNYNYTADIVDGSSLSSLYINENTNSAETGTDIYPYLGLCDSLNHSVFLHGYMSINSYTDGSCLGRDVNGNFNIGVPPREVGNPSSQGSMFTMGDPYLVGNPGVTGSRFHGSWFFTGGNGCLNLDGRANPVLSIQQGCDGNGLYMQGNSSGAYEISSILNGIPRAWFYVPTPSYTGYQGDAGIIVPNGIEIGNDEEGGTGSERLVSMGSRAGLAQHPAEGNFQFFSEPYPGANMGWTEVYTAIVQTTEPVVSGLSGTFVATISGTNMVVPAFISGSICAGGTIAQIEGGGSATVVSLPGGAVHGCTSATGTYVVASGGSISTVTPTFFPGTPGTITGIPNTFSSGSHVMFTGTGTPPTGLSLNQPYVIVTAPSIYAPTFTPGTPGRISGLPAATFTAGSHVTFSGTTPPTGLSFGVPYVIITSSDTVATIGTTAAPTVPLAFSTAGSGDILGTSAATIGTIAAPTVPLAFSTAGSGAIVASGDITSTGQGAIAVTLCPSPTPTVGALVVASDWPAATLDTNIGTYASCAGSVLHLQAPALNGISITNVSLKFLDTRPSGRIANDANGTSWRPANPTTIAGGGLVACGSTTVGLGVVTDGQTAGAAGYNTAIGAGGGSTTRLVFCDGASWTYH